MRLFHCETLVFKAKTRMKMRFERFLIAEDPETASEIFNEEVINIIGNENDRRNYSAQDGYVTEVEGSDRFDVEIKPRESELSLVQDEKPKPEPEQKDIRKFVGKYVVRTGPNPQGKKFFTEEPVKIESVNDDKNSITCSIDGEVFVINLSKWDDNNWEEVMITKEK